MPNRPSRTQWQQLYTLADQIKELAPWNYLYEGDLFGVRDPVTGEDYFVSVMGRAGDHFAVSFYVGALALYQFWSLQDFDMDDMDEVMSMLMSIRQLQLSFEDRQSLEKYDLTVIKQLGRKYRGRAAWPMYRSFKPGYLPWRIDDAEAAVLIRILEQAKNVLLRASTDANLLKPVDQESYLMRISDMQDGDVVWRDEIVKIAAPPLPHVEFRIEQELLDAVRKVEKQRDVELDISAFPAPVTDEEGRPYIPALLLAVDSKTGLVHVSELLPRADTPVQTTINAVYTLLMKFANLGWAPKTIIVRKNTIESVLQMVMKLTGLKIKTQNRLAMHDRALEALVQCFGGPGLSALDFDDDDTPPPARHRGVH